MGDITPIVIAVVIAFFIILPSMSWLRRVCGYMVVADVLASAYVVSTFAATGAVSGLIIAVWSAIGLSVTLRVFKALFGYEQLVAGVETEDKGVRYTTWTPSLRLVTAELLTQAAAWIYAFVKATFTRGKVVAPSPLLVEWRREPGWLTVAVRDKFNSL